MVLRAGLKEVKLQMQKKQAKLAKLFSNTHIHAHCTQHSHTQTQPHAPMHTVSSLPQTQIPTCLQTPLHRFAQGIHHWVALYGSDDITDGLKGILSALLLQCQMKKLILLCWVQGHCDPPLITSINDIVV